MSVSIFFVFIKKVARAISSDRLAKTGDSKCKGRGITLVAQAGRGNLGKPLARARGEAP